MCVELTPLPLLRFSCNLWQVDWRGQYSHVAFLQAASWPHHHGDVLPVICDLLCSLEPCHCLGFGI